jgi:hypothetical protein
VTFSVPWSVHGRTPRSVRERERETEREREREREKEGGREKVRKREGERCRIWLLYFHF